MDCRFCKQPLRLIKEASWYVVRHCAVCDIYQTEPKGFAGLSYNERAYDEAWHTMARLSERRVLRSRTRLLKGLPVEKLQGKRLLEIGPGAGELLRAAAALGCEVLGVEMNRANAEYIRKRWGLPVLQGKFEETKFEQFFDIVVMLDVIEHIEDPRPVLASIKSILMPGGLLLLTTPNPANLFSVTSGYLVASSFGPDHVTLFTPQSLQAMLDTSGFTVVRITTYMGSIYLASALVGAIVKIFKEAAGKAFQTGILLGPRMDRPALEEASSSGMLEGGWRRGTVPTYWLKLGVWLLRVALGYILAPIWFCPERFLGPRLHLGQILAVAQPRKQ